MNDRPRYCEECWEKGDHGILATFRGKDRDGIMRELCGYHLRQSGIEVEATTAITQPASAKPVMEARAEQLNAMEKEKAVTEKQLKKCNTPGCDNIVRPGHHGKIYTTCLYCRAGCRPGYKVPKKNSAENLRVTAAAKTPKAAKKVTVDATKHSAGGNRLAARPEETNKPNPPSAAPTVPVQVTEVHLDRFWQGRTLVEKAALFTSFITSEAAC